MPPKKDDRSVFDEESLTLIDSSKHADDPFEEFRGINGTEIGKGKRAVLNWVRDVRGEL